MVLVYRLQYNFDMAIYKGPPKANGTLNALRELYWIWRVGYCCEGNKVKCWYWELQKKHNDGNSAVDHKGVMPKGDNWVLGKRKS